MASDILPASHFSAVLGDPWGEEHLYHLDQLDRHAHWKRCTVPLDALDVQNPTGRSGGPILVLPHSMVPVAGWDAVRQAQARGERTIDCFMGAGAPEAIRPFGARSLQEKANERAFEKLPLLMKDGTMAERRALDDFFERDASWHFDAIALDGQSLLGKVIELMGITYTSVQVSVATKILDRGANPNRLFPLSPRVGDVSVVSPIERALACFIPSSQDLDPERNFPEWLADEFLKAGVDWGRHQNLAALNRFFERLRPSVGPLQGAEKLYPVWRGLVLDTDLPSAESRPSKPRF